MVRIRSSRFFTPNKLVIGSLSILFAVGAESAGRAAEDEPAPKAVAPRIVLQVQGGAAQVQIQVQAIAERAVQAVEVKPANAAGKAQAKPSDKKPAAKPAAINSKLVDKAASKPTEKAATKTAKAKANAAKAQPAVGLGILGRFFAPAAAANAKVAIGRQQQQPQDLTQPTGFLTDPNTTRRINEARRLLSENRFDRAVGLLQMVLDEPDDSFIQIQKGKWVNARTESENLIAAAGPDCLAEYRKHNSDQAAHALRLAAAGSDARPLADVMRRFFLTEAGFEAANRLASYQLDRGQPGVALVYLDRILASAVHRQQATPAIHAKRAVALAMVGRLDDAKKSLAEQKIDAIFLGGTSWPVDRLLGSLGDRGDPALQPQRDWPIFGGANRRVALSAGAIPLLADEWAVPLVESNRNLRGSLLDIVEGNLARKRPTLFALHPLVVGNTVYYRDYQATMAVDLHTGKVLWRNSDGGTVESESKRPQMQGYYNYYGGNQSPLESAIVANSVYGSLSTDGQRVYQADEMLLNPGGYYVQPFLAPGKPNPEHQRRGRNRLTALDAKTGKPVWHVGGEPQPGKPRPQLEDTFFFGPPLPMDGLLYLMGEGKSEIRLFALEATTGQVQWSKVIAVAERRVESDPYRRCEAAHLAYADGILVCPTNLYRVAALDPLSRTVLWDYSFPADNNQNYRYNQESQIVPPPNDPFATDAPLISQGRVIVSSSAGTGMHCLDLQTGKLLWRADRSRDMYLAGIYGGKVLAVGNEQVRALRLTDGNVEWTCRIPIPSGRGLCLADQFLVPLSDGSVSSIDIKTGKLLRNVRSRVEEPIGNLLATSNRIVAAGMMGLRCYPLLPDVQKDVDRLMAADANDPRGLFKRAQLRLAEGKTYPAIEDLRLALRQPGYSDRAPARNLLFDVAAKEAIEQPEKTGEFLDELQRLAENADQRGIYYRLLAEHRLAAKDYNGALEAVDKHAALLLDEPIPAEKNQIVRQPTVWTRYFVGRLLSAAGDMQSKDLLARMARRLEITAKGFEKLNDADKQKAIGALYSLAFELGNSPLGEQASLLVADRLLKQNRRAEAELSLLSVVGSKQPAVAAEALVKMAAVSQQAQLPKDAHFYLKKLAAAFPQTVVDGKTGKQHLDDFLAAAGKAGGVATEPPVWKFDAMDIKSNRNQRNVGNRAFFFNGPGTLPFFEDRLITYEMGTRKLEIAHRESGKNEWTLTLPQSNEPYSYPNSLRVEAQGHLMFFAQANQVYAVSLLERKLLWSKKDTRLSTQMAYRHQPQAAVLGPVGPGFVALRQGKDLVVLDAWTGKELWLRKGVKQDQWCFGDEQYLFVVSGRDNSYQMHRTLDGSIMKSGSLASVIGLRRDIIGRDMLLTESKNNQLTVRLWDPATETNRWLKTYPSNTQFFPRNGGGYYYNPYSQVPHQGRYLVLLEQKGKLTVLERATGEVVLTDELGPDTTKFLVNMHYFNDKERHFLAIDRRQPGSNIWYMGSMPGMVNIQVNGPLHAYSRQTGKRLWVTDIKSRSLVTTPGEDLPILFSTGQRYDDKKQQWSITAEIFDKRTGKSLHTENRQEYVQFGEIAYNAKEGWAEFRSWNMTMRVEFISKAEAEKRKAQRAAEKAAKPAPPAEPGGIWNTIDKLGKSLIEGAKPVPAKKAGAKKQAIQQQAIPRNTRRIVRVRAAT